MKRTLLLFTAVLFIHLGVPVAQAAPNVSVDFFYDQLGDYGDWVEVGEYGYGWQPRDVDEDWRPYSDGRWAYTDAGWTWMSDEPYGWAVYHYGRWAQLEERGWVWIPGTEWAPAWVSWRRSPQYVGWAPLPPEAGFRRNVGISAWVDSYYDIGPSAYRFVETRNFGAQRLRTVFVEPRENVTIIRQTTNITRITYVNSVVNNGGPRYEDISRESAEPVRRLRLERRLEVEGDRDSFRGEQMRSRVEGDSLRVFAPGFETRAVAPPPKVVAKIDKVEINRGWKDAGPAADVEKLRAKVRGEAKAPKSLPPQPKFEKLTGQAAAPEAQPVPGAPEAAAPREKPVAGKPKDARKGNVPPIAPVAPPAVSEAAPPENAAAAAAPAAPMKPVKPGKAGRAEKVAAAGVPAAPAPEPTGAEAKPEGVAPPPAARPANPKREAIARKAPEQLRPPTSEPSEPPVARPRPEPPGERPPAPERPALKNERAFPPEPAPHREAPQPPRNEPRKPEMERPEAARQVPPANEGSRPKMDRQNPPAAAPQPAPRGEAPKSKPGKGKAKDEKNPGEAEETPR